MILNATHSFVLVMILCIFFPEVQSLYMYYSNFLSRELKHTPHSISGIFLDENKLWGMSNLCKFTYSEAELGPGLNIFDC